MHDLFAGQITVKAKCVADEKKYNFIKIFLKMLAINNCQIKGGYEIPMKTQTSYLTCSIFALLFKTYAVYLLMEKRRGALEYSKAKNAGYCNV